MVDSWVTVDDGLDQPGPRDQISVLDADTRKEKIIKVGDINTGEKINSPEIALARYRAIPNSTARKIAWVGDSTTDHLFTAPIGGYGGGVLGGAAGTGYVKSALAYPGGPYYNVTHGDFGQNGGTLAAFVAGTAPAGMNVSDVVTFAPDLVVLCYGINDIRWGAVTKAELKAYIVSAVELLQAALPECDVILRMPNALLYDAANTNTYIDAPTSLSKVQGYSDILRLSYRESMGLFPNTFVLDTQKGKFQLMPEVVSSAAGLYMFSATDSLHPNTEYHGALVRNIALCIGDYGDSRYARHSTKVIPLVPSLSVGESAHATAVSANDYLIMPRVCEDATKYNLLYEGKFVTRAAGSYMDVDDNQGGTAKSYRGVLSATDIMVQYGTYDTASGSAGESIENGVAAKLLTGITTGTQGNNIRLFGWGAGYPHLQYYPEIVRFFRARPATQKNDYDPNFSAVLSAANFTAGTLLHTVQKFGVAGSLVGVSVTAVTIGGTITLAKNGVDFAVLTWADGGTVPSYSGAFFTDATRGMFFNEGDIISAVISGGFVGGTFPKITLSNR